MHQTHPTRETLEGFTWRQLPPAEMLDLSDHLVDCAVCRAQLAALGSQAKPARVQEFLGPDSSLHLSEEELASAAHDATSLSSDGQTHLDECADCRAEVDDARRFSPALSLVQPAPKVRRVGNVLTWPAWSLAAAAALALSVFIGHTLLNPAPSAPQLVAELRDNGAAVGLTSDGHLTGLPALSASDAALVKATLSSGHLPVFPRKRTDGPETLRGAAPADASFRLLNPSDEVTLQSPQLSWEALPSATNYRVLVYNHAFNLAAESPVLTSLNWTVDKPLSPGETYTWIVKASTPQGLVQSPRPPAPEVHFTIATASAAARIADAQRGSSSHVLLAALYAREDMITLSRHEISALEVENPSSALVKQLANSLAPE